MRKKIGECLIPASDVLLVVPVDVRDWEALFPPETPGPVRAVLQRLREGRR